MAKIFVSYRRDDASSEAGRITDWLDRHFGQDEVFMDITALEPGVDFVDSIEEAVETIDALIAVIGPSWVDAADEHGNRRLDDPADWVRLEIANGLARGIRVIPVLVKGAAMPPAAKLPDDLQALRRRNALPITEGHWRSGIEELIKALEGVVTKPEPDPLPPPADDQRMPPYTRWMVLGVVVGAAMLLSGVLMSGANDTFLHPSFGGSSNFHDSDALWRSAGIFTTLPTLTLGVSTLVAVLVARRDSRSRIASTGAIPVWGLQGFALYAAILANEDASGFAVAMFGGLLIVVAMLPALRRLLSGVPASSDMPLPIPIRVTAVLGAGVMFAGMVADFNGGGTDPPHVNISSVLGDRVERWDLLVVVAIATAIGLLAPILRAPRALLGGALVACGVGAIGMWPRFFGLPLIENSSIASPGYGGFIGVAGAVIILFAGRAALHASRR